MFLRRIFKKKFRNKEFILLTSNVVSELPNEIGFMFIEQIFCKEKCQTWDFRSNNRQFFT